MSMAIAIGISPCFGGGVGEPAIPLPSGTMLIGANLGNIGSPGDVATYETWLGKNVDAVNLFAGRATWSDLEGSIGYVANLYSGVDRARHFSIPLLLAAASSDGLTTLAAAAAGTYNSHYHTAAVNVLANAYPTTGAIIVRTGWEMNYSGQEWYSYGKETDYIGAFRQFVNTFRAVSNRFKFVWCPNFETYAPGPVMIDTELSYPGDAYVDIISMDFYVNHGAGGFAGNPSGAYNYYFGGSPTTNRRIPWLVAFAAAHNKPVAIDEWACMEDNYQTYIASAQDYFAANNFYYTKWWESTSAYNSKLSAGNYYFTGRQYRRDFGIPPAWTPAATLESSVTLVRWYSAADAASITTVSGLVSQWNDKSANAKHLTQATSGNRPPYNATSRNGKPALEFDGSTDILASTDSTNIPGGQAAITLAFAAYGESDLATFRYFIQISGSAAIQVGAGSGQVPRWQTSAANYSGSGSLVSNDRIAVFTVPAGSSVTAKVQVDGNTETSAAGITRALNTMTGFHIGSGSAHVRVKDVLIFAGEMSTDDKDRLAGYLAWTYSTVANLPVGHPWKSTAPTL